MRREDIPLSGPALRDFLYMLHNRTERDGKEKKRSKLLDDWHSNEKKIRFRDGKWYRDTYKSEEGHNGIEEEVVIDGVREKE